MTAVKKNADINSKEGDVIGYIGDYCIQCINTPEAIETEWKELQKANTAGIYQNYDWVRIACKTLEKSNQIYIVTARDKNGLQFILPLVLEGSFFKTLRWIGNTHANVCSGLFTEAFLKTANKSLMTSVFKVIAQSIKSIAQSKLINQPSTLKSFTNPMMHLPQQNSINNMYDMDLRDGLDVILDQGNGKKKRKLWRKQNRLAENMGGYELVIPETKEAISEAIEELLILKAKRLKSLGIPDIFADQNTVDFLNELATFPPLEDGHLLQIFQLKIAGKTRAMYVYGISGKYCQAYVNAVEYDEFSEHSPGEMVLYALVDHLCEKEYERLDLGVGDERYKVSWCPGKHQLFDTTQPLSAYAVPFVAWVRMKNALKRYIRNNPSIWLRLKKFRKAKASLFPLK